ncbi:MAG TPA: hypothetical protein VIG98_03540 [Bacillus sp. (in: firmicutes)]
MIMMFLELALYFLIGLTGLLFLKIQSFSGFVKAVLFVLFWPFYLLLEYIKMVDKAKKSTKHRLED